MCNIQLVTGVSKYNGLFIYYLYNKIVGPMTMMQELFLLALELVIGLSAVSGGGNSKL